MTIASYFVGGVLVGYMVTWFFLLVKDRPAVVRHPLTGQWTAARSLIVQRYYPAATTRVLPPTQALPPIKE